MPRPAGLHESAIQINLDVSVSAGGRSEIDGKPGPTSHRFVRITETNVKTGAWLINPTTNETHKVLSFADGCLMIDTKRGAISATVEMIKDLLLLVEPE